MKKTLLLFAIGLMGAGSAFAQTLVLKSHGVALADGERVNIASYWDEDNCYFNPEITLTSSVAGTVEATTNFVKSECSPALELDEDGFDYQYGIGNATVQMCSFTTCQLISVGQSVSQTGTLEADTPHDMLIELGYTIGFDDPGLENKSVEAEFVLTVVQGNESVSATFYVDMSEAGVESIDTDTDAPVKYYDLNGRVVTNPGKGIFIKRQGSKVSKIIL